MANAEAEIGTWQPHIYTEWVNCQLMVFFLTSYPNAEGYDLCLVKGTHTQEQCNKTKKAGEKFIYKGLNSTEKYQVWLRPVLNGWDTGYLTQNVPGKSNCYESSTGQSIITTTPMDHFNADELRPFFLMTVILVPVVSILFITLLTCMIKRRFYSRRFRSANDVETQNNIRGYINIFPLYPQNEACEELIKCHMSLLQTYGNIIINSYDDFVDEIRGNSQEWVDKQLKMLAPGAILMYCSQDLFPSGRIKPQSDRFNVVRLTIQRLHTLNIRGAVVIMEPKAVSFSNSHVVRGWKIFQLATRTNSGLELVDFERLVMELHGGIVPQSVLTGWKVSGEATRLLCAVGKLWDIHDEPENTSESAELLQ